MHVARYDGEQFIGARKVMGTGRTEQDLIEEIIQADLQAHEEVLRNHIERMCAVCESPIERVFGAALVHYNSSTPPDGFIHIYLSKPADPVPPFDGIHVWPQARVDGYRIDFLFAVKRGEAVRYTVVELDGHDYHERTKRQASYDKARDRHFTKKGWMIARFTGADVWADPDECVGDAMLIVEELGAHIQ